MFGDISALKLDIRDTKCVQRNNTVKISTSLSSTKNFKCILNVNISMIIGQKSTAKLMLQKYETFRNQQ